MRAVPDSILKALATQLRLQAPLEYYRMLSIIAKTDKQSTLAVRFRDTVVDGIAVKAISLSQYIRSLYKNQHNQGPDAPV
jgi:hypothetical protein